MSTILCLLFGHKQGGRVTLRSLYTCERCHCLTRRES